MLKHMLNGNAAMATAAATGNGEPGGLTAARPTCSSSPDGGGRDSLPTTRHQQQHHHFALQAQWSPQSPSPLLQRCLRQPSDSVDNGMASHVQRATVASEPEYQNTRHRSSPASEFCHGVPPPTKSVRSPENVAVVSEPELRTRRPAVDPAWMVASTRVHHSAAPGQDSSSGSLLSAATFALVATQQQQQQPTNHGDATTCNVTAMAPAGPSFAPVANGPTKPLANGGLHIAKRSPIGSSAASTKVVNRHAAVASDSGADIGQEKGVVEEEEEEEEDGGYSDDCGRDESVFGDGIKEILTSLGLLCLISLLLALLSLIFLLKISPVTAADLKDSMRAEQFTVISPDEYVTVYEVTLALCSLTLSLNLCCLLVCSVQFLFAVKLARSSVNGDRLVKIFFIWYYP